MMLVCRFVEEIVASSCMLKNFTTHESYTPTHISIIIKQLQIIMAQLKCDTLYMCNYVCRYGCVHMQVYIMIGKEFHLL